MTKERKSMAGDRTCSIVNRQSSIVNRKRLIAFTGALLAAVVWVSCGGREGGNALSVSGNIELTEVKVAFKIPGKLIELGAEEGGMVKKGMALGRLDTLQTRRQREREEAGLTAAQSQLAQLRTAIEFQKATLAAELDLRRAEVKQAEARLHELLAGSRSQEIEQAKAAVEAARTQQVQAAADWERRRFCSETMTSRGRNSIRLKRAMKAT